MLYVVIKCDCNTNRATRITAYRWVNKLTSIITYLNARKWIYSKLHKEKEPGPVELFVLFRNQMSNPGDVCREMKSARICFPNYVCYIMKMWGRWEKGFRVHSRREEWQIQRKGKAEVWISFNPCLLTCGVIQEWRSSGTGSCLKSVGLSFILKPFLRKSILKYI